MYIVNLRYQVRADERTKCDEYHETVKERRLLSFHVTIGT